MTQTHKHTNTQTQTQEHNFAYYNHLEEMVPKDVAKALADNPVTIPDVNSVYMAIDSLAMNMRPFDELNQFRTRCFNSFASHQRRNLSLSQVRTMVEPLFWCCTNTLTPMTMMRGRCSSFMWQHTRTKGYGNSCG